MTRHDVAVCLVLGMLLVGGTLPQKAQPTPTERVVLGIDDPTQAWGGLVRFFLSPHCVRSLVRASVACGQVGLTGLAGCGVLLVEARSACP
jgi:hypothetical protein